MQLTARSESWPIAGNFTIARGSKTSAEVVVVELQDGNHVGRGECVPYARYNETVPQVLAALQSIRARVATGITRHDIAALHLPMAAANALDCALWDVEAKRTATPVWQNAKLQKPAAITTAYTISLNTPEAMAEVARAQSHRPLLKLKLGRDGDHERLRAVRTAAPLSQLIIDANEGWTPENLPGLLALCVNLGVTLIEQPLPVNNDEALRHIKHSVPICADESTHGQESLASLHGKYDAINIKLDKTGGLTPALATARQAQKNGFSIMVGCMLATSLAMAPALLLAQLASIVDLDGPLLLAKDREPGLTFTGSTIHPSPQTLWG